MRRASSTNIIILTAVAIALLLVFIVIITEQFRSVAVLASPAASTQTVAPIEATDPAPVERHEPAEQPAAPTEPTVQAVTDQAVEQAPQPEVEVEAIESPWTGPMNTVGIAPADQPIVLAMVFTRYDWDVHECACSRQVRALASAESRLHYLNLYVSREYGSWAAAQAQPAEGHW